MILLSHRLCDVLLIVIIGLASVGQRDDVNVSLDSMLPECFVLRDSEEAGRVSVATCSKLVGVSKDAESTGASRKSSFITRMGVDGPPLQLLPNFNLFPFMDRAP